MGKLIAPNGLEIEEILETCPCAAGVADFRIGGKGELEWEYSGNNSVFWDEQHPVERAGQVIVIDSERGEWPLNLCKFVDDNGTEVQVNG